LFIKIKKYQIILYLNKNYSTINVYKFERKRLGRRISPYGGRYGAYLYRNMHDNTLLASWDKPIWKKGLNYLYKGEDLGYCAYAMIYYKNY